MTSPTAEPAVRRRFVRLLPVADQLVWSAANVAMVVAAARLLTAAEFGTFSAVLLIIVIALAISRSYVTEPLMLGVATAAAEEPAGSLHRRVLGAAVLVGVPLAAVAAAAATVTGGGLDGRFVLVVGLTCWVNVVQDAVRFVGLGGGRVVVALASDAAWLGVSVAVLAVTLGDRSSTATTAVAVWGVGAASGVVVGVSVLGAWPRLRGARSWLVQNVRIGSQLAADATAGVVATNLSFLLVGVVAGREALAGLRGAYVLLGPMNAVTAGLYLAVVPALARRTRDGSGIGPQIVRLAIGLTLVWAAFSLVVLAIPERWKAAALGDTWSAAEPVVAWLLVASVVGAVGISATYGVRAWRDARSLLRVRAVLVPCYLLVLPLAAVWNDAVGYAMALVAVGVLQAVLYVVAFLRADARGAFQP